MSGDGDKNALICPIMSGQLVVSEGKPGGVVTPGKAVLIPSVVICARERCEWWHTPSGRCGKIQQAEATLQVAHSVMEVKAALEPLRLLIGSLRRLSDKLNDLILAVDWKKGN